MMHYSRYELHVASEGVAQDLLALAHAGLLPPTGFETPTVASRLSPRIDPYEPIPYGLKKAERYAIGGAISGLVLSFTIDGDGPDAHFTNLPIGSSGPPTNGDPYEGFCRSLQASLSDAEDKLSGSAHAGAHIYLRKRYDWTMTGDPSTSATRTQVTSNRLSSHSEGPYESEMMALLAGVALGKAPESTIQDPDTFVARQLTHWLGMARAGINVTDFRAHSASDIDGKDVDIIVRCPHHPIDALSPRRYTYDMHGQSGVLTPGDPYLKHNPRLGPTIMCVATLIKIRPEHEHTALQNFLFATVNAADELGLYDRTLATNWRNIRRTRDAHSS